MNVGIRKPKRLTSPKIKGFNSLPGGANMFMNRAANPGTEETVEAVQGLGKIADPSYATKFQQGRRLKYDSATNTYRG